MNHARLLSSVGLFVFGWVAVSAPAEARAVVGYENLRMECESAFLKENEAGINVSSPVVHDRDGTGGHSMGTDLVGTGNNGVKDPTGTGLVGSGNDGVKDPIGTGLAGGENGGVKDPAGTGLVGVGNTGNNGGGNGGQLVDQIASLPGSAISGINSAISGRGSGFSSSRGVGGGSGVDSYGLGGNSPFSSLDSGVGGGGLTEGYGVGRGEGLGLDSLASSDFGGGSFLGSQGFSGAEGVADFSDPADGPARFSFIGRNLPVNTEAASRGYKALSEKQFLDLAVTAAAASEVQDEVARMQFPQGATRGDVEAYASNRLISKLQESGYLPESINEFDIARAEAEGDEYNLAGVEIGNNLGLGPLEIVGDFGFGWDFGVNGIWPQ